MTVLSLKFCPHVSGETLQVIAEEANPFFLRELYLDGCDKVFDHSLAQLVQPKKSSCQTNIFLQQALSNDLQIKHFSSIVLRNEEAVDLMLEMSKGGARGLEILSLSECKNITDFGLAQ